MSLRLVGATLVLLSSVEAAIIHLPSDVGTGAENHIGAACMSVMGETKAACSELSFGASNSNCDFAVCYTANLNRDRCKSVVTDGTPENIMFPKDLDKIQKKHDVVCGFGGQGGPGIRNAKFDCQHVAKDGMWDGTKVKFLQTGGGGLNLIEFAKKYPASAQNSALEACLSKADAPAPVTQEEIAEDDARILLHQQEDSKDSEEEAPAPAADASATVMQEEDSEDSEEEAPAADAPAKNVMQEETEEEAIAADSSATIVQEEEELDAALGLQHQEEDSPYPAEE